MKMPWCKLYADFYYCPKAQSMSEAMQRRFIMLLCLRCDGELEKLGDDEVRTALRISLKQWLKTKVLFITKGFIDQHLNVLNWEKRQSQYGTATRYLAEKGSPKSGAQRAAECRARKGQKAPTAPDVTRAVTDVTQGVKEVTPVTEGVTDVTHPVTPVTDGVTSVTNGVTHPVTSTVTRPENLPENSIKIQHVTACNENPLDIDIDLDKDIDTDLKSEATSKSIALPTGNAAPQAYSPRTFTAEFTLPQPAKADNSATVKATAEPVPASPAVDPETDVAAAWDTLTAQQRRVIVEKAGAKHNVDQCVATDWPQFSEKARQALRQAWRALASLQADDEGLADSLPTSKTEPNPPAEREAASRAGPDSPLALRAAPLVNGNGVEKGILHADPNSAKNEQKQTGSAKPAKSAQSKPSVVQAEAVDEGNAATGKRGKKELTQAQKNLNATIWQRYQAAYVERYGAEPVRNAKVNKQISDLRERLGHEAPDVAAFYVGINDSWLIRASHDVGNLLQRCESYRTQWITDRQVNSVTARQMENTQANVEAAKQATQALSAGWVNPLDALMARAKKYGSKTLNEIKALEAQT